MSAKHRPSIAFLRQCFRHEDGKLFWLHRPRDHFATERAWLSLNAKFADKEAGGLANGRCTVGLNGRDYYRYQIIWALHTGEWVAEIDHKNQNPFDDRIDNLRPATRAQNIANRSLTKTNTSGFKGVSWRPKIGKWAAQIFYDGRRKFLGHFDDPVEAHRVYMDVAKERWGEFAFSEKCT